MKSKVFFSKLEGSEGFLSLAMVLRFFLLGLVALPILVLFLRAFFLDALPISDPDTHGFLVRSMFGQKEPSFTSPYVQGWLLRFVPFGIFGTLVLSRLVCSLLFFFFLALLARFISKKHFFLVFSFLSLWALRFKGGEAWVFFISHSLWYNALNACFFVLLCSLLFSLESSSDRKTAYLFVLLLPFAYFTRISIFLPLFCVSVACVMQFGLKKSYKCLLLYQIFLFPLFYLLKLKAGQASFKRKALDTYVFPRSHFYNPEEILSSFGSYFVDKIVHFFSIINIPLLLIFFLSFFSFLFSSSKKVKVLLLSFWILFFSYLILSFLGKFTFLSFRYNFELAILSVAFVVSFVLTSSFLRPLKEFLFLFFLLLSLLTGHLNSFEDYRKYTVERGQFSRFSSLVDRNKNLYFLADFDSLRFMKTYFSKKEIKSIGYHHRGKKYRKKSARDFDSNFFEKESFAFVTQKCKFSRKTKENVGLCSSENYLDYEEIMKNFKLKDEACYNRICFAVFEKGIS